MVVEQGTHELNRSNGLAWPTTEDQNRNGLANSYLVIRAAHLWGRHKLLAVELVSNVNPKGVWLSIHRSKFQELPDNKTDADLADEVEIALWNDEVLRVTDYHEVDVQVKNGVVWLSGMVSSADTRSFAGQYAADIPYSTDNVMFIAKP